MRHGTTWQDQWERIYRWRERVRKSRDEVRDDGLGTEDYRDEVFALFQAIWHLKDWLHNDTAVAADATAVDAWVRANGSKLLVAADVANGSKHMALTNQRAGGSSQTRNDVTIFIGRGVQHTFYIHDSRNDGDEYEAVDLADRCLAEWSAFLSTQELSSPS